MTPTLPAFPYELATTPTGADSQTTTPTVVGAAVDAPTSNPFEPFSRIIGLVLGGTSVVGLGASLIVVGMIHQSRR